MLLHEKLQTVRVLRPASRGSLRAGHPAYQGGEARTPEDPVAHAIAALLGREPTVAVRRPDDGGELMDIFAVEHKERLGREEVAERLRNLADMLARHNDIEFQRGGMRFTVHVPDEVNLKVELDVESEECELEIELTW